MSEEVKDIFQILSEGGIEIPEESKEALNTEIRQSYKSVVELNKIKADKDAVISELNGLKVNKETLEDELNNYKTNYTKTKDELQMFKISETVRKAGVAEEFKSFISHEVSKLVNDEKDFETALSEYIESNPQYKVGEKKRVSSSLSLDGKENDKGPNEAINDALLRATGRRK